MERKRKKKKKGGRRRRKRRARIPPSFPSSNVQPLQIAMFALRVRICSISLPRGALIARAYASKPSESLKDGTTRKKGRGRTSTFVQPSSCLQSPPILMLSVFAAPLSVPPPTTIEGITHPADSWTNLSPTVVSKLGLNLHLSPDHPLGIIRSLIEAHFDTFTPSIPPSAVVTVRQNFDELGFPADHPGRAKTDSYYVNQDTVLRTHTSAHEIENFHKGLERWLLSADVYRRDEIDSSHYPAFHQMEGASVWTPANISSLPSLNDTLRTKIAAASSPLIVDDPTHPPDPITNPSQPEHDPETLNLMIDNLKLSLNSLLLTLFRTHTDQQGEPLQIRWTQTTFPWTAPSYEVEVLFGGKWLEVLGCGVVKQDTLQRSGS